jgi:methylmalonyl-CoA/ethylmalonyl-CoA epimerase
VLPPGPDAVPGLYSFPGGHPPNPPGVIGIDHVGLAVADLDQAIAFHTQVLGLRLLYREVNIDQQVTEAMLIAGPDGRPATVIQLLATLPGGAGRPSSALQRFLDRRGPGLHHLAYRVSDVVFASSVWQRHGLRLLYDSPRAGTRGSLINFVHPRDAGGILIELVQVLRS